jgi:hypothetical protein
MNIAYITPPNYDFLCSTLIEGLTEIGHKVFTSTNSNYGIYLNRNHFIDTANKAEILIIGSGSYIDYSILKKIKHNKVIYVDGSDYLNFEKQLDYPINLVFKREILLNHTINLVFPLPFAAENRYFKNYNLEKNIISFVSTMSNYFRRSAKMAILNNFTDNIFVGTTGERSYNGISGIPSSTPIYNKLIAESIASINIPGKGWDCARYWEIISNKTCLITQRLSIQIPNNFIENVHYLGFSTIEELIEKISYIRSNPNLGLEMGIRAYNHLVDFHTTKKRAEYFLNIINKHYENNIFVNFEKVEKIQSRLFYIKKQFSYKMFVFFKQTFLKKFIQQLTTE